MRHLRASVLVLCLVAAAASCVPMPQTSFDMQTVTADPEPSLTAPPPATATPFQPPTEEPGYRLVSVLLGADADPLHPERNTKGIRTDVFVIVVVDIDPGGAPTRVTFVNVPRDMLAYVPCSPLGTNRVNAAWYLGGYSCIRDVVLYNYGLEVNGPVVYGEMRSFIEVVDRMGGVDVVPGEEYLDFCGTMGTESVAGEGMWKRWLAGATYHMDGNTALCYVRGRRVADGDLDRTRRAQEFLTAALSQWPKALLYDPQSVVDVAGELLTGGVVTSDADFADMANLAFRVVPNLGDAEVHTFRWVLGETVAFGRHPTWGSTLDSLVQPEKWVPCLVDTDVTTPNWAVGTTLSEYCTGLWPMTQPPVDQGSG